MISILIVEDEKPISELIKLNLELNGYECTQAYDGMQACDLIEDNTYDLMLLDIMLPKVNGFEVMEYAKENGTLQPGLDSNRELFIENHKKYWGKIMKLKKMAEELEEQLECLAEKCIILQTNNIMDDLNETS